MKISDLDREEYKNIVVYTMQGNNNDNLPVYIRKVSNNQLSPLHRHEMIQINYVIRGRLIHRINNSQYELVKGDIFIIPPYIPHQLLNIPGQDFEIMELEAAPEFISGSNGGMSDLESNSVFYDFSYIEPFLVSERNVRPRLNLSGQKQLTAEALLHEIYDEYTKKEDSYLLVIKADMLKLLVLVGRYFREDVSQQSEVMELYDHHRDAMKKAVAYIDGHFSESLSIESISRVAMLSQSYFSYLFKVITNKTFVEYLNSKRILHAMEMLKNTDELVVDVCFESGFKNVNHFNRTFKNVVGLSPTQYRKANRKNRPVRRD